MEEQFFDFFEVKLEEKRLADTVFTAFDFETTGLYPTEDRIIEVGMVQFTLAGGPGKSLSFFIDPRRVLPSKVTELCGITQSDLDGASLMEEKVDEVLDFLEGTVPVAHNINFDYGFLAAEAARAGKTYKLQWGIDTVALARKVLKGHRSYSLQNLAKDLGLSVGDAHRALDDARLCEQLFRRSLEKVENHAEMTVKEFFHLSNTRIK